MQMLGIMMLCCITMPQKCRPDYWQGTSVFRGEEELPLQVTYEKCGNVQEKTSDLNVLHCFQS